MIRGEERRYSYLLNNNLAGISDAESYRPFDRDRLPLREKRGCGCLDGQGDGSNAEAADSLRCVLKGE